MCRTRRATVPFAFISVHSRLSFSFFAYAWIWVARRVPVAFEANDVWVGSKARASETVFQQDTLRGSQLGQGFSEHAFHFVMLKRPRGQCRDDFCAEATPLIRGNNAIAKFDGAVLRPSLESANANQQPGRLVNRIIACPAPRVWIGD